MRLRVKAAGGRPVDPDHGGDARSHALSGRPDQLARATGTDRDALERLLTALSTVGLCARTGSDSYALTELGAALDGAADQSFKAWAIFEGEMLAKSWSGMLETIVTGRTAAQLQGFDNSFEMMSRSPATIGLFNAATADLTRLAGNA